MSALAMELSLGTAGLVGLSVGAAVWLRLAAPLLDSQSRLERVLDSGLILAFLGTGFFYLLAGTGFYRLWIAVVGILGSGLGASWLGRNLRTPSARSTPDHCSTTDRSLAPPDVRDPWLWATVPVLAIAGIRLIKAMAAPPMTRDAMTMHLPKPAFWIQSGSLSLPDFPDAWSYYRWFPDVGEILFSWVMLPFRRDLLLGPFGVLVWLALLASAARLARALGAGARVAWLAGAAVASLPSITVFMTANYVDNLVMLFVLFAVTHAVLLQRTQTSRHAILGLAAAGLAIGTKASALVVAAPIVAAILYLAARLRLRFLALAPAALALTVPCAGYFRTWLETGSPLYPFRAPLLPLPYHEGLADLFAGRVLLPAGPGGGIADVVRALFWSPPLGQGHMNFGLGGAILAVAALAGLIRAVRGGGHALFLATTLTGALISTLLVFTDGNLALRTLWVGVLGRHLLVALAPIMLCSAFAPERAARIALTASLLTGTLHQLQIGWSPAMIGPALQIAAALAVATGVIWVLVRSSLLAAASRLRLGLAALVAILLLFAWTTVREQARWDIYRETSTRGGAFDAHPGHPAFAMGAELWPLLDTPREKVIAVTVGKDQVGHNQFFYPLLGSRLQNRLIYLPVADSEEELSDPAKRYTRADPDDWLTRLDRAPVDLVVGLWQLTPERDWLSRSPEDYEVIALTNLGVPWIARRHGAPSLKPEATE